MTPRTFEWAANGDLIARYSFANGVALQIGEHRHGVLGLAHRVEAEALVVRDLLLRRAEADRAVAAVSRALQEGFEELLARALAPAARHDSDRQLGRLRIDEPEAGLLGGERPVPGGAV